MVSPCCSVHAVGDFVLSESTFQFIASCFEANSTVCILQLHKVDLAGLGLIHWQLCWY